MLKSIILIFAIAITTCSSQGCAPAPVQQNFDPSRVRFFNTYKWILNTSIILSIQEFGMFFEVL
jgi:hypothetical protein